MTATMEDAVGNATGTEATPTAELPIDMQFNSGHMVSLVFYPILMVISAVGNITVFVILLRRRKKCRSRINNMLLHLSIADLLVTFLMMPVEIAWNYTVVWHGGDALCRILSFCRMFGLFLSSYILICISVDRYFAVLRPMQISDRRGRCMLVGAWVAAIVSSLPQAVVFQALTHPDHPWYVQCITEGVLTTQNAKVAYAAFGTVGIYILPLAVIIFSYASILVEIFRRSRDPVDDKLRRSSLGFLGRAKIRTLKMTIIIVFVFFVCSTPYYIMMFWYWVDPKAAVKVDPRLQKGLLLFCSANSCMNPIVYGAFNIRTRRSAATGNGKGRPPKNPRLGALGVLRLVSWRREREEDGGAGAGGAAAASTGSSSEHAAHALGHRGSRGSQGSEVSCTTEWSEVHSTSCLRQGVDSSLCSLGDAHDGGAQAHAQERAQGRLPGGGGSVATVQGVLAEPAATVRVHFPAEDHRFRLAQRSSSAPGIPSGAGPGLGPAARGLYGGRMFELRGNAPGLARGAAAGARRNGCGRGKGAGRAGGAAGGASEVTSSV